MCCFHRSLSLWSVLSPPQLVEIVQCHVCRSVSFLILSGERRKFAHRIGPRPPSLPHTEGMMSDVRLMVTCVHRSLPSTPSPRTAACCTVPTLTLLSNITSH
ncbi:hypothetical protein DNTS_018764 [Danionella cerebrum]|uniref:Uncharacterized protein n=1 Tax=Danionella cerebrum TaxID=2873325 RepID=A0A553PYD6_9TELE|nr:hypothetical protein DNTS_018764 [Danionella translucida]